MTLFAHAVIEVPVDPEDASKGVVRYERGDVIPDDLLGVDELVEHGSVSEEEYDPAAEKQEPPAFVEIDGVRYARQEADDDA